MARLVMNVRRKDKKESTVCDFTDFISEETMLVNDPLFSKEAIEQYNEKEKYKEKDRHVCHVSDTCEHFMKKTLKEKMMLLAKENCYYACYQPMSKSHNVKNFTQRLTFRKMSFHYVKKWKDGSFTKRHSSESKESAKRPSVNGKLEAKVISMCVVRIWLVTRIQQRCSKHMLCWITATKVPILGMN